MLITDLVAILKPVKSDQRIIMAAPRMPLPSLKKNVRSRLVKAYKRYEGNDNIGQLSTSMRSALDASYAEAYMLGKGSNEISKREVKWINKQKREQFNYLDGFMTDLDAGESRLGPVERIDAYLKKLDGMYWSGYIAGSGEDVEITWNLSAQNNCDDCLDLADGSPYGRGELEAAPGDGSTACLYNCGCFLTRSKE